MLDAVKDVGKAPGGAKREERRFKVGETPGWRPRLPGLMAAWVRRRFYFFGRLLESEIPAHVHHRNPWTAAFLSLLPGAGQVYNHQYKKAVLILLFVAGCVGVGLATIRSPYSNWILLGVLGAWVYSFHDALVTGIRDYLRKCGFSKCVIGLSGGIDSAVTCALAAEAQGTPNVLGMGMPSSYSSTGSIDDAAALAHNLGIRFELVPIKDIVTGYMGTLEGLFEGTPPGVAEENVQSRIRGNLLMAMSNKYGSLVLTTGNKSEIAVGYCTLYGDMSGGLSVLSDVPKTMVYELARYINREREIIPESSITKAPSAELRPNQTDQDTLPPYDILDQIIHLYVEEDLCASEIVERGFARETVKWVLTTIDRNEYKRRQAAPGLKVTSKAFGVGRRMPVAAKIDVGL
jgi:NAD+ synthetase